jgi:phosphatidate cytidylyltransferase
VAVGVGVAMAAVALILFNLGPGFTMILVTAVLVGAAAELYAALRKVGYQPATLLGLTSVGGLALASFWRGEAAFPLVLFLSVAFALLWFLFADTEARPVPNLAVTMLGIGYIGVLGSFAALILKHPDGTGILTVAILGTAAYDIGGLFVGSSAGRSRLAPSVSPNKTYEGLAGGMVCALFVTVVAGTQIHPWDELGDALALGVVLAAVAPLGDLAESMVKRDLDIKDMSTILPGHGGLLDRFDALLFVLPATYYLCRLLDIV